VLSLAADSFIRSRRFSVGIKSLFQKFVNGDKDIELLALCFTNSSETCDTMEQNGYDAIVLLFSEKPTDNLASVRHSVLKRRFFSATNFVTPERFPLLRQQHNSTP